MKRIAGLFAHRTRRPRWTGLLLVAAMLALGACSRTEPVAPEVEMTPAAGGVTMPTPAVESPAAPTAAPVPAVLAPGQSITVGAEGGSVRIYADASLFAPVMDVYDAGVTVVILESSGDHDEYPVAVDGFEWYRVRTPDGLVGWIVADALQLVAP